MGRQQSNQDQNTDQEQGQQAPTPQTIEDSEE